MAKYRFKFSELEIKHIIAALFALAIAFSFILFRKEIFYSGTSVVEILRAYPFLFLQSLIAVGIGFVLHELGHKYVAQKKGLWAEFRAWPAGLLLAIGLALLSRGGFVFAAPGAVMINPVKKTQIGYTMKVLKPEDVGKIGIIGSVINVALAIIFSILSVFTGIGLFEITAQVNAWLALFNQIPFAMLDGAKVFYWSKGVWAGFFIFCIALFGFTVGL